MGETAKYVHWIHEGLFGFLMCYTPPVKNPAIPMDSLFKTNADQVLSYSQTPYVPLFVQPKHGTSFEDSSECMG